MKKAAVRWRVSDNGGLTVMLPRYKHSALARIKPTCPQQPQFDGYIWVDKLRDLLRGCGTL